MFRRKIVLRERRRVLTMTLRGRSLNFRKVFEQTILLTFLTTLNLYNNIVSPIRNIDKINLNGISFQRFAVDALKKRIFMTVNRCTNIRTFPEVNDVGLIKQFILISTVTLPTCATNQLKWILFNKHQTSESYLYN